MESDYDLTGAVLKYSERYYPKTTCTQCGRELTEVYVVPTTHSSGADSCYAVTFTFSCPEHRANIGYAFGLRIVADIGNGAPFLDHPDFPPKTAHEYD